MNKPLVTSLFCVLFTFSVTSPAHASKFSKWWHNHAEVRPPSKWNDAVQDLQNDGQKATLDFHQSITELTPDVDNLLLSLKKNSDDLNMTGAILRWPLYGLAFCLMVWAAGLAMNVWKPLVSALPTGSKLRPLLLAIPLFALACAIFSHWYHGTVSPPVENRMREELQTSFTANAGELFRCFDNTGKVEKISVHEVSEVDPGIRASG